MSLLLATFFSISFIISISAVAIVAKENRKRGIAGIDVNKADKRELPESAGIALLAPLWTAIIMFNWFIAENTGFIAFGLAISVLSIIGLLDDRKHKFKVRPVGLASRAVLVGLLCIMFAMFFAPSIFWLLPFALFIGGLAAFENTFAGLNGWEVGSGFIIACFVAALLSPIGPMPIGIALVGAIAGLLVFNIFPAKVFPGDSGTMLIGASIACLVILNQSIPLMFLTALFFLPHAIDFFLLKLLTNPHDVSQSKQLPYALGADKRLRIPAKKGEKAGYDFAKMLLRLLGPMQEWKVVALIWAIVAANCLFWVIVFQFLKLI